MARISDAMASPHQPGKKRVDLATPAVRVSRIRRDPPVPVKVVSAVEIKDRDSRTIVIGVLLMALALFIVMIGLSNAAGWSPSQYTIHIRQST